MSAEPPGGRASTKVAPAPELHDEGHHVIGVIDEVAPAPPPGLTAAGPARRRGSLRPAWLFRPGTAALVAYALLGLLADFPIYPGDPSRLPSMVGEDIVQTVWFLEWTPYALLHGHNLFTTTYLNYPVGVDLAQNTGMPLLGLLSAPLTLTAGPIASLNLLRWTAFFLSAYAAFAVIRRWTTWTPAAFVGGLFYGFSPYMAAQGSVHLNLTFVPLPPVILYLCYELLVTQRKHPAKTGALLGFACAAQYYISAEVLATTAIVGAIALFVLFFSCIAAVPSRLRHGAVGLATAALVLAPLIAYPTWLMFHGAAHYSGPAQGFNNVYNADLLGPILPTSNQLIRPAHLASLASGLVGNNPQENGSYLSIPLLLLATAVVVRYWRRLWTIVLAILTVAAFSLSLGPLLVVDGHPILLPVDLPFRKIDHLPGVENILPVRFSLYVVFFVAVLLAMGLDAYYQDLLIRRRRLGSQPLTARELAGRALGGGLVLASLVALVPNWPYRSFPARLNPTERPSALARIPAGSIVLAYPYPTTFADQAMLWQALDSMRFKLLGGYALVPNAAGRATVFPSILQPSSVEAMLVNSITPVPDPDLPDLVATAKTIEATRIVVTTATRRPRVSLPHDVAGRVASVDPKLHRLIIDVTNTAPVAVSVTPSTIYVEPNTKAPSLAGVTPGRWVIVSGTVGPGTVTATVVTRLRSFLRQNHVDAIVDDLGLRDSWEIGLWIRQAIGKPTRAGGGGEIWTDVPSRLRTSS